jgi:hypothetical protein
MAHHFPAQLLFPFKDSIDGAKLLVFDAYSQRMWLDYQGWQVV